MDPNQAMPQQPMKPFVPWYAQTPFMEPVLINNFLSQFECDQLIEFHEENPQYTQAGKTGGAGAEVLIHPDDANNEIRQVRVIPLNSPIITSEFPLAQEILNKIIGAVTEINETSYRFDIDNVSQVEFARYPAGGGYGWHTDTGAYESARSRKLSFSIQINDPDDYEGGEFQADLGGPEVNSPPVKSGDLIIFPSFLKHQVNKVTSGERYSIFGWFEGPRFK